MELRHLRTFLAVAEEESITGAARRLFTAQPAVTRQIKQLEVSLDTCLFDRTPQGVSLTTSGESLRPEAERLVAHADSIAENMRNDRTRLGGLLRVGIPEEGLGVLEPVVLAAYCAAHPNVEVVLDHDADLHHICDLADWRLAAHDVILWGVDLDSDALGATSVYGERLQLAVPVDSDRASSGEPVAVDEALEMEHANMGPFMTEYAHRHYLSMFRNGTPPRLSGHEVDGVDALYDGLARGTFNAAMTPSTPAMAGVALVDLDQAARTDIGVITRSDEQRQHVTSFSEIAASVGRALYSLVPEALAPHTE